MLGNKNSVFDACFYHCYAMISKGQSGNVWLTSPLEMSEMLEM